MKGSNRPTALFGAVYKHVSLARIALKDTLFYPTKAISEIFITAVRVGILVVLYSYAYHYFGKNINGMTLQVSVWSIAMYFILLSLNARRIFQDINDDIVSGRIEMLELISIIMARENGKNSSRGSMRPFLRTWGTEKWAKQSRSRIFAVFTAKLQGFS